MNLYDVAQGWARAFTKDIRKLDVKVMKEADRRLKICDTCSFRVGSICSKKSTGRNIITDQVVKGCGCNVKAKSLADRSECPAGKW